MTLGGIGAFPNFRRARVVWMGVEQEARLELLHHDIELACESLGFEVEGRAFRPHLTLARVKHALPEERLRALSRVGKQTDFRTDFIVRSVDLMSSELSQSGPTYRTLVSPPHCGVGDVIRIGRRCGSGLVLELAIREAQWDVCFGWVVFFCSSSARSSAGSRATGGCRSSWLDQISPPAKVATWEPMTSGGAIARGPRSTDSADRSGPVFETLSGADVASYAFRELAQRMPASADSIQARVAGEKISMRANVNTSDIEGTRRTRRRCSATASPSS